jgi:hypothetical protein
MKTTAQIAEALFINGEPNQFLPRPAPIHFREREFSVPAYEYGKILGQLEDTDGISDDFKFGSTVEDRVGFLCGLMEAVGTITRNGDASILVHNRKLSQDIRDVVASLGGTTVISEMQSGKYSDINIILPMEINPFVSGHAQLARETFGNSIRSIDGLAITTIEYVGVKEVQCIMIDNPEHLYITDDFIVTHNTLSEKMAAWAGPLYDNLQAIMKGKGKNLDMYIESGAIEIVPPTFMRGRSLNKTFMILDEGQSLTRHEMKTIATRVGEDSRLIVTGDLEQIDNPRVSSVDNGLAILVDTFRGTQWAVCLNLIKGERSGFASAAADLL